MKNNIKTRNNISLIKTSDSRLIDAYELYAKYEGEYWGIKIIDFMRYKITIVRMSITKELNLNEVQIIESKK